MNRFSPITLICLLSTTIVASAFAADHPNGVSAGSILHEMNLARQNPSAYAEFVEQLRGHYSGREGVRALDDAIRFLRSASPVQPLNLSSGMCKGAADHCADQANGGFSHGGRDGSNPSGRMSRYGTWGASWGENIAYGKTSARDIVVALIIDDGQPARKHRKNIFNPNFNYAGAAFGHHARFRTVCTTDFAGTYAERGQAETLIARNP
jgi:uncharacterized protein YkwD